MLKSNKKNFATKAALMTAAVSVATSGAVVATAPSAFAYGGKEDPSTGIVWGVAQDGTYMTPTSGGELQGFCIDPTLAYPKQGSATKYGDPKPWGENMKSGDKKRMAVALYLGKLAQEEPGKFKQVVDAAKNASNALGSIGDIDIPGIGKIKPGDAIPGEIKDAINAMKDSNLDEFIAGSSAVVHEIGAKPEYGGNNKWGERHNQLSPEARKTYDIINKLAPMLPDQALDLGEVKFSVREPEGGNKQRMILMSDVKIPQIKIPGIPKLPNMTPPKLTESTDGDSESSTTTHDSTSKTTTRITTEKSTTQTTPENPTTPDAPGTTPTVPGKTTPVEKTTPSKESETPVTKVTRSTTPKEKEKPAPEIRTSAGTKDENVVEVGKTIVDTVTFKGLEKGETYTIVGETYDKNTGNSTGNNGQTTFTAEESDGEIDVKIPVNNADSSEQVVFEKLYKGKDANGEKVAEHADINDASQTVGTPRQNPNIRTSASSSTGNYIQSGTTVDDTVTYTGLVPGKTYRLEARLMCKETGADTGANATHEFTPETSDGSTVVSGIAVTDPDCFEQVAFEKLYELDNGTPYLVAAHEDINDAAQTVGGPGAVAKKKKKKVAPSKKPQPAPIGAKAKAKSQSNPRINNSVGAPGAPAPAAPAAPGAPAGGGSGAAPVAPRQVINSVPSGGESLANTIFAK